jgi:hypothetical protein
MKFILYSVLIATLCFSFRLSAEENIMKTSAEVESDQSWRPPASMLEKYDWLKLTSDEWLKGELIAMYDREFEFDSDELGLLTFD